MFAAEKGLIEMAKLLLERGADIDAADNSGKTALMIAEENKQKEMMEFLKNWGKTIEQDNEENSEQFTPTFVPTIIPSPQNTPAPELKNTPLPTQTPVKENINKNEALLQAAKDGNINKVKELLSEGANVNAKDSNGKTALMYAAEKGYLDIVKLLVNGGANIHAKDSKGKTAIMYALDNKHKDIAAYLMQKAGIKK